MAGERDVCRNLPASYRSTSDRHPDLASTRLPSSQLRTITVDATNWIWRGLQPAAPPVIENRARIVRMNVSPGTGGPCAYCEKEIQTESVEYEVDAYVGGGLRTLHFHRVCLHLWEALL